MAKGLHTIAAELGLLSHTTGRVVKFQLIEMFEQFPCFQKVSKLQRYIESRGHLCKFLPKFHCELNPVERIFAVLKRFVRERCTYTYSEMLENIHCGIALLSLNQMRRFSHRCDRYMRAVFCRSHLVYTSGIYQMIIR